jgi:hypothetical protein
MQATAATAPDVLKLEAQLVTAEQERQQLLGDGRELALRMQVWARARAMALLGV